MKSLKMNLLEKKEMGEIVGGVQPGGGFIHACTCWCGDEGDDVAKDERNDVYRFRNPGININVSLTGSKDWTFFL